MFTKMKRGSATDYGLPMPQTIYIDGDACPVKNEVYKVAKRFACKVVLVANTWMRVPAGEPITVQIVANQPDAADHWIVANVQAGDIVVTADIPLAGLCLERDARVLSPSGKIFDNDNIGQALATRDLLTELRSAGQVTGGPPPFGNADRSRFLQQLHNMLQTQKREK
jgi:uncharacterized protein YaiI (UPF0178 family)